jgi:hypothetical protein
MILSISPFVPFCKKSIASKIVDFPELFSPIKIFKPLPGVVPSGVLKLIRWLSPINPLKLDKQILL